MEATVTNVLKIAWNLMQVTLQGADFSTIISLTNPEDFEDYQVGEEVTISIEATVPPIE